MTWVKTERLELIPFTRERMLAAHESPQKIGELLGMNIAEGWPGPDIAGILTWLAERMEEDPELANWIGLIVHTADQTVIGDIGFKSSGPDETGMVEFGYMVAPSYRGQGYATEAAKGLAAWALEQPGVTRVTAECLTDNIGSIRVLEKTGLQRTGTRSSEEGELLLWEIRK